MAYDFINGETGDIRNDLIDNLIQIEKLNLERLYTEARRNQEKTASQQDVDFWRGYKDGLFLAVNMLDRIMEQIKGLRK